MVTKFKGTMLNFGQLFREHKFLTMDISGIFYPIAMKFGPLPSNIHLRSNGDCLEGKRENCQSVVCNDCARCNAHTYEQT